ncbi:hypothetical protein AWB76_07514 [Caballeronia temeraria]|uniref:Uncharacterized protein n=1 Tax=Caballeronia temeraria TaxID=1777137 RepID=A0A158DUP4_9BURK|nr:hypothetical protein AWB76_07514 [Caballeronia temeraria]
MTVDIGGERQTQRPPTSLQTLAKYLELSLDAGESLIMTEPQNQICAMYVGDPFGREADLRICGAVEQPTVDEILRLTHVGTNDCAIDGQAYRFVRSFTKVGRRGAVVFAPV